jgi:hypothetical protein
LAIIIPTLLINTNIANAFVWTGYGVKVWATNIFGWRIAEFGVTLNITLDVPSYTIVYARPGQPFTYNGQLFKDGIISCAWYISCSTQVTYFVYTSNYAARHRSFTAQSLFNSGSGDMQIEYLRLNSTHVYVYMGYQINSQTVNWGAIFKVIDLIMRLLGLTP